MSVAPDPVHSVLIGYTAGVFDLFHAGHLNLLRRARSACDFLVVGVTTDELAHEQRDEFPVVGLPERMAIVQSVRHVDQVVPQLTMDKLLAWRMLRFDVLFVGDVLRGTAPWDQVESDLDAVGVRTVYLPATYTRSGELLSRGLQDLVAD